MPETLGNKTILVVDDEPAVRNLVVGMLARLGHTALAAESGDSAVAMYRRLNQPIDLLVTDVVAPGMSGPMLADQLAALQPGLKVLYISGYDRSLVVQKYVVSKGHALLSKPFTAVQLEDKLDEVFRSADAGAATG